MRIPFWGGRFIADLFYEHFFIKTFFAMVVGGPFLVWQIDLPVDNNNIPFPGEIEIQVVKGIGSPPTTFRRGQAPWQAQLL